MITIGSFSIILNDKNEVLLCHRRDKDLWNLPGGRVEEGESPWDAAIREAKEEIGVDVVIKQLVGINFKPEKKDLVFTFISEITRGDPVESNETDKIKYFLINNLPKNTAPKQKERLEELFKSNFNDFLFKVQIG